MKRLIVLTFIGILLINLNMQRTYAQGVDAKPLQTPNPIPTLAPIHSIYLPVVQRADHPVVASGLIPNPIPTLPAVFELFFPIIQH